MRGAEVGHRPGLLLEAAHQAVRVGPAVRRGVDARDPQRALTGPAGRTDDPDDLGGRGHAGSGGANGHDGVDLAPQVRDDQPVLGVRRGPDPAGGAVVGEVHLRGDLEAHRPRPAEQDRGRRGRRGPGRPRPAPAAGSTAR